MTSATWFGAGVSVIGALDFEFVSDLVLRISNLIFCYTPFGTAQ
jgi:hypothetical protein